MKRIYLLVFAALSLLFTSCNRENGPSNTAKAKYTVTRYANDGENMDLSIESNLAEAVFINTKGNDYSARMVVCMKYSTEKGLEKQSQTATQNGGNDQWVKIESYPDPMYNRTYSCDQSTFDQKTGWTRRIKANPVQPFNNPPFGDDGDLCL